MSVKKKSAKTDDDLGSNSETVRCAARKSRQDSRVKTQESRVKSRNPHSMCMYEAIGGQRPPKDHWPQATKTPRAVSPPKQIKFQNWYSAELEKHFTLGTTTCVPQAVVASTRRRPAAAQSLQPRQTQYLGEAIETSGTAATSLKHLIPATNFWATTPRKFPSATTIPRQSTIQSAQPQPAHPSAQSACAGVRSESPQPAERTNKTTADSYGTGGLSDRPHLLRRSVSSPAPFYCPALAARAFAPAPACPHGQSPPARLPIPQPHTSTTPLTHLKQLTAASAFLARRKHPGARCCPKFPSARFLAPKHPSALFSSQALASPQLSGLPRVRVHFCSPRTRAPSRKRRIFAPELLTPPQIASSAAGPLSFFSLSRPRPA